LQVDDRRRARTRRSLELVPPAATFYGASTDTDAAGVSRGGRDCFRCKAVTLRRGRQRRDPAACPGRPGAFIDRQAIGGLTIASAATAPSGWPSLIGDIPMARPGPAAVAADDRSQPDAPPRPPRKRGAIAVTVLPAGAHRPKWNASPPTAGLWARVSQPIAQRTRRTAERGLRNRP
jgi:hypothetical protein